MYVKAITYEDAQRAWLKLRAQADRGAVASNVARPTSSVPTIGSGPDGSLSVIY
jgi:hypothetical protein